MTKRFHSVADAIRWLSGHPDRVGEVDIIVSPRKTLRRLAWGLFASGLLWGAGAALVLDLMLDPPVWSITIRI